MGQIIWCFDIWWRDQACGYLGRLDIGGGLANLRNSTVVASANPHQVTNNPLSFEEHLIPDFCPLPF
jgi:hypothetical protein